MARLRTAWPGRPLTRGPPAVVGQRRKLARRSISRLISRSEIGLCPQTHQASAGPAVPTRWRG